MKRYLGLFVMFFVFSGAGCAPAIIGAGAAGGYKVGTDARSVGQMWDDATITARVKAALLKDSRVKMHKIDATANPFS